VLSGDESSDENLDDEKVVICEDGRIKTPLEACGFIVDDEYASSSDNEPSSGEEVCRVHSDVVTGIGRLGSNKFLVHKEPVDVPVRPTFMQYTGTLLTILQDGGSFVLDAKGYFMMRGKNCRHMHLGFCDWCYTQVTHGLFPGSDFNQYFSQPQVPTTRLFEDLKMNDLV